MFVWADGDTYVGEYKDGLRNGYGTYIWKDGSSWYGTHLNNMFEGLGIY